MSARLLSGCPLCFSWPAPYRFWARRGRLLPLAATAKPAGNERERHLALRSRARDFLLALLVAVPAAFHSAADCQGVMFARAVMFRMAIYTPALAIPLGLLLSSIIYLRRRAG